MPIPSDQNIWASFPAWCQRQNMWGLQTGFSVFQSIPKPGDIAILFGSAGHIQKTSCFMVNFSSLDKTKSKNWKDFRRGTAVVLCAFPYYLRRWKLNKWQIMALARPQSLGGMWCQGEATSFRKPAPVLRWPGSHTRTHTKLCLETSQHIGCSHSWQTQTHQSLSALSVVSEGQTLESRSSLSGPHFNIVF